MADTPTEALPDLTDKELRVWDACCAWDKAEPGCDVWVSHLRDETAVNARAFSALLHSLHKKGYIYRERDGDDVQLTCRARRAHYLTPQHHCLHEACCA